MAKNTKSTLQKPLESEKNSQVVVLSLRRSGSSMLSGVLHKLGVPMGLDEKELQHSSDRNKWGFYEDLEIVRLSEDILKYTKAHPQLTFARIEMEFEDRIKEVIGKRDDRKIWGFKDVNQVQTHRLFKKHLSNPRYIAIFRNPLDVSISLQKWRRKYDHLDLEIMRFLKEVNDEYSVLLKLLLTIQQPMQFVSMERLKQHPGQIVKEIASFLKINPTKEQMREAISHVRTNA